MEKTAFLLVFGVVICARGDNDNVPRGHMLPLGSHMDPQMITTITSTPISTEFHEKYVQTSTPVIIKGVLNSTSVLENWGNDDYLRERFGDEEVNVEHKKKENRSETGFLATMTDYLSRYKEEDIYMVSSLTQPMMEEWLLPRFLLCGGYTDSLIFSYGWFSSGGTRSVLHTDAFDNLHCLVSGLKEFVMFDPAYIEAIGPEYKTQGYYNIDVDQVDMLSHSNLTSVPWYLAEVWPGDCLYLPHLWVHHVRSHGRNFGVNLWWSRFQYDPESCYGEELPDFAPLSNYPLVPELQLKDALLGLADDNGIILATDLHRDLKMRDGMADLQLETIMETFEIMKPGCEGELSSSDLYSFPKETYVSAFKYLMSVVQSVREEDDWADEGGEWGEGGWEDGEGGWGYSEVGDEWVETEDDQEGGGDFPHDHQPHDEL